MIKNVHFWPDFVKLVKIMQGLAFGRSLTSPKIGPDQEVASAPSGNQFWLISGRQNGKSPFLQKCLRSRRGSGWVLLGFAETQTPH